MNLNHYLSGTYDWRAIELNNLERSLFSIFEHREDDWKSLARTKLRAFEEELHAAHEAGMTYSGLKAWTFINSAVYCMTIVTTIGAVFVCLDFTAMKTLETEEQ